ncbi:MAG: M14 family metallopeptidase [Gammaproteobacteria bacterium]|jgi:hypothetical protein
MAPVLTMRGLVLASLLGLPVLGHGNCVFNSFGDIVNANDPGCRDIQLRYTRNDDTGNNIALGYDVPLPVESLTAIDGYRSYQSLHAQHQALDVLSPGVEGIVVGQTVAGRDIWAYRVGDPDSQTADGGTEAAALINGTIHAREWQAPEAVTELFEQLTEISADGGFGRYLYENVNVVILPVLNVDGFLQTQRFPDRSTASELQPRDGRMRRKNLRHSSSGSAVDEDLDQTADNFLGVDLNRNNPDGFGQNGGSSSGTTSIVYRGTRPQSEPEIAALLEAAKLGPESRLRLYTDTHSFSQIFITPITGASRQDRITRSLVGTMQTVLGGKYRYGQSTDFIGLTSEYFANELMIPAWTLEIEPLTPSVYGTDHGHSGFILPNAEVARMRDEVAAMLLAALYAQADKPTLLAARIRDAESGEIRYEASWGEAETGRQLTVSRNQAILPGRAYRLWLGFNKPMRWRNQAGALADFRQLAAPGMPEIGIQFPQLPADEDISIPAPSTAWKQANGPDGVLRYRDDALEVTFTVPASFSTATPTPMVIAVDTTDITRSRLDADPSTRVAWNNGHWSGYEDETGAAGDQGGTDCHFQSFVAMDAAAAPPAPADGCRTAAAPIPPTPVPDASGGGGGGAVLWLLLCLIPASVARRRGWWHR